MESEPEASPAHFLSLRSLVSNKIDQIITIMVEVLNHPVWMSSHSLIYLS